MYFFIWNYFIFYTIVSFNELLSCTSNSSLLSLISHLTARLGLVHVCPRHPSLSIAVADFVTLLCSYFTPGPHIVLDYGCCPLVLVINAGLAEVNHRKKHWWPGEFFFAAYSTSMNTNFMKFWLKKEFYHGSSRWLLFQ